MTLVPLLLEVTRDDVGGATITLRIRDGRAVYVKLAPDQLEQLDVAELADALEAKLPPPRLFAA